MKIVLVVYFCVCLSLVAWTTAEAPKPQVAYAIVDQSNNIIMDYPSDVTPPGDIRQFNIFPDQSSAASQMVEWNDIHIDTSHFKIVRVMITKQ